MDKRFNKSDAYRTLLSLFRQAYGNAPIACLATWNIGGITFTILGTEETIEVKNLPLLDIAQGDMTYVDAEGTWVRLPGNTSTRKKYLSQVGTGTSSFPPVWDSISAGAYWRIDSDRSIVVEQYQEYPLHIGFLDLRGEINLEAGSALFIL